MDRDELRKRTKDFALRIIRLVAALPPGRRPRPTSAQVRHVHRRQLPRGSPSLVPQTLPQHYRDRRPRGRRNALLAGTARRVGQHQAFAAERIDPGVRRTIIFFL